MASRRKLLAVVALSLLACPEIALADKIDDYQQPSGCHGGIQ